MNPRLILLAAKVLEAVIVATVAGIAAAIAVEKFKGRTKRRRG